MVDDFGFKYTRREDTDHLLQVLEKEFTAVSTDWDGVLYCGITLEWNYKERWLDISIPGYIKKVLQKYLHKRPTKPQHSPYIVAPKKYGKEAQDPLPPDKSSPLSKEKIKRIQGIVGSILFYARSVDSTFLVGLNSIAMQQTNATINTLKRTCRRA